MSSAPKPRILLVEDHLLVREALALMLQAEAEIVGSTGDGQEALSLAVKFRPDVVLLDLRLPGIAGLDVAHRLAREVPSTKVLVVSQYDDEEYVIEALREARVAGYLLKGDSAGELLNAIRAVRAGKRYLSPSIAPIVLDRLVIPAAGARPGKGAKLGADHLTRREREILKQIGEGVSHKLIASRLGITVKTVQVHRANLMAKLRAHSTAEIVRHAIKRKLIRLD